MELGRRAMGVGHEARRNIVTVYKSISIAIRSSTSRSPRDREAERICTPVHTRACRRVNSSANTCGAASRDWFRTRGWFFCAILSHNSARRSCWKVGTLRSAPLNTVIAKENVEGHEKGLSQKRWSFVAMTVSFLDFYFELKLLTKAAEISVKCV